MTNQEAIKILGYYDVSDIHFYTTEEEEIPFTEWSDAIEMAISALQAQDLQPTCNQLATDCVSRQAAIDAVSKGCQEWRGIFGRCEENLLALPSAQQEAIPLEWINNHLEFLDNCDNDFAQLAKVGIKAMVESWKKDRI